MLHITCHYYNFVIIYTSCLAHLNAHYSSIRGHVGAQKARVNGIYGVNDEIVITNKLVKSIWFFCSISNFALSKVNFIELVSKT